jgi:tetratricopeptide (TPR) repeat protein
MLHFLFIVILVNFISFTDGNGIGVSFDGSSDHQELKSREKRSEERKDNDFQQGLSTRAKNGPEGALKALSFYKSALRKDPTSVEILDEIAEVYSELKRPAKSLAARREALAIRVRKSGGSISIADFVASYAAIAQDLQHVGDYKQATEMLIKAKNALGPPSSISSSSLSYLLRMESNVFECSESSMKALESFEFALDVSGGKRPRLKDMTSEDLLTYVWLLRRAMLSNISSDIVHRESVVTRQLLKRGPWVRGDQLPKELVPNLLSKPWHSVDSFQGLDAVKELLERYSEHLKEDLRNLQKLGLMLNETECINDSSLGQWTWFATNGYWLPNKVDGCSANETPHACKLLSEVSKILVGSSNDVRSKKPLRVVRGSFSVLGSFAHLHTHCGTTNAQLKMHVGLDVPLNSATGQACASLRVSNETRYWAQNKVLFFDDSFAHEVRNECDAERSVFQLVFVHPDAPFLQKEPLPILSSH